MTCREILITLYRNGLIVYPLGLHDGSNKTRNRAIPLVEITKTPITSKLANLGPVELKPVRNSELESLYNSLVASR